MYLQKVLLQVVRGLTLKTSTTPTHTPAAKHAPRGLRMRAALANRRRARDGRLVVRALGGAPEVVRAGHLALARVVGRLVGSDGLHRCSIGHSRRRLIRRDGGWRGGRVGPVRVEGHLRWLLAVPQSHGHAHIEGLHRWCCVLAVFFAASFGVSPETEGQSIAAGCGPSGSVPAGCSLTCSCAAWAHLHISAGHSSVAHIMPHHASETWLLVALQLFGSLDAATRCTGFAWTHSGAGETTGASPSGYLAAVSVARAAASLSLHSSMPVLGAVRLFLSSSRVLAL